MPQALELPAPVMGRAAGFHHHRSRSLLGEERSEARTGEQKRDPLGTRR